MNLRVHLGRTVVAGSILTAFAASVCGAQTSPTGSAPCTVAPQPVPCSAAPAQAGKPADPGKPATNAFPFPGEEDPPSAPKASPATGAPTVTSEPGSVPKKAGSDFPFPGEDPAPAANGASSSSSSSSSGDDPASGDPDAAGLKDKGSEGTQAPQGRHILHRVNPIGTKLLSPEEREAEDLDVAHFYTQTGDLKGAYLRTQDAVKTAPSDPDAHYALAGVALKLNKKDEAIAEYNACLKLDPDEKEAKAARKELERLKP